MNAITLFLVAVLAGLGLLFGVIGNLVVGVAFFAMAAIVMSSLKMANTWQKFVVLRAGKLQGVRGPGLFAIFPVLDSVVAVIDERHPDHGVQRGPSPHVRPVALVLIAKLLAQRRLFVGDNEQEESGPHERAVLQHRDAPEQEALAGDQRCDCDVHRIADVAIEPGGLRQPPGRWRP